VEQKSYNEDFKKLRSKQMKALQLSNIGKIAIQEISIPQPQKDQALLKVRSCAICRTDAKMWKMGHRDLILPRVLGHECCAIDDDTGKRYVIWPGSLCGQCDPCRNGYENLCVNMQIFGFHKDGGFAEYAVVGKSSLVSVPDNLSDNLACLAEPLACAINALQMADVQKGMKILVYGAGPVGLMMALAAKVREAVPTVYEINPEKIKISRNFQDKTGISVMEKLPKDQWHTVINAAPGLEIFKDGIERLESGGCFCIFSGFTHSAGLTVKEIINVLNDIHYRQLRVSSAYGCTREQIRLALEILQNHPDELSLLIEKIISIENIPRVLPKIWAGDSLRYVVNFG
jgi:L-iditol 2-dehydrogenase